MRYACLVKDAAATIAELNAWLVGEVLPLDDLKGFVDTLGRRLRDAGLPMDRITTGFSARHPELSIVAVRWSAAHGPRIMTLSHEDYQQVMHERGPFSDLDDPAVIEVRCQMISGQPTPYPVVERMRAEGVTDYLALRLLHGRIAYATCEPAGFSANCLAVLRGIAPILALQLDRASRQHTLGSLLKVYLGHDAARRVLDGQVRRGTGVEQRCALWFCDMRGFTELSDRRPRREVVALLDEVFERVGGAIADHGGVVLKFIGDAVLATFPIVSDPADASRRALAAAHRALAALDAWNVDHPDRVVAIGVALHVGDVLYGNVGARERLDFTVIGAAVNEVCRIEALCKPTGVRLLCSEEFADAVGREHLTALGQYPLKGVARPLRVFGGE